ncbi:hypothetical protein BJ742DRAFT_222605 [Cladochytrium replicatum]|nr:hypothetical protein BJ742DRAFT_222605 [Cladochytrium replicatum]
MSSTTNVNFPAIPSVRLNTSNTVLNSRPQKNPSDPLSPVSASIPSPLGPTSLDSTSSPAKAPQRSLQNDTIQSSSSMTPQQQDSIYLSSSVSPPLRLFRRRNSNQIPPSPPAARRSTTDTQQSLQMPSTQQKPMQQVPFPIPSSSPSETQNQLVLPMPTTSRTFYVDELSGLFVPIRSIVLRIDNTAVWSAEFMQSDSMEWQKVAEVNLVLPYDIGAALNQEETRTIFQLNTESGVRVYRSPNVHQKHEIVTWIFRMRESAIAAAASSAAVSTNTASDSPARESEISSPTHTDTSALAMSTFSHPLSAELRKKTIEELHYLLNQYDERCDRNEQRIKELETIIAAGRESLNDIHAKFQELAHVNEALLGDLEAASEVNKKLFEQLTDIESKSMHANNSVQELRQKLEERKAAMEEKGNTLIQLDQRLRHPRTLLASQRAVSTVSLLARILDLWARYYCQRVPGSLKFLVLQLLRTQLCISLLHHLSRSTCNQRDWHDSTLSLSVQLLKRKTMRRCNKIIRISRNNIGKL